MPPPWLLSSTPEPCSVRHGESVAQLCTTARRSGVSFRACFLGMMLVAFDIFASSVAWKGTDFTVPRLRSPSWYGASMTAVALCEILPNMFFVVGTHAAIEEKLKDI